MIFGRICSLIAIDRDSETALSEEEFGRGRGQRRVTIAGRHVGV